MVGQKKYKVVWTAKAAQTVEVICKLIGEESVQASKKVKSEIFKASKSLSTYPEKYQLDEYYPQNPGTIRRFFRWSYRVVYEVFEDEVVILNIYNTSQSPFLIGK